MPKSRGKKAVAKAKRKVSTATGKAKGKAARTTTKGGVKTVKGAVLLRSLFHDIKQQVHVEIISTSKRHAGDKYPILGCTSDGAKVHDNILSYHGNEPRKGETWSFTVGSFEDGKPSMPVGTKLK